jgi:hypothetical protein
VDKNNPPVYMLTSLHCLTCGLLVYMDAKKRKMTCNCGTFPAFLLELKQEPLIDG